MKVCLEKDEWWPVYVIDFADHRFHQVEVPDDLMKRYKAALTRFDNVQAEMRALYEEHVEGTKR